MSVLGRERCSGIRFNGEDMIVVGVTWEGVVVVEGKCWGGI